MEQRMSRGSASHDPIVWKSPKKICDCATGSTEAGDALRKLHALRASLHGEVYVQGHRVRIVVRDLGGKPFRKSNICEIHDVEIHVVGHSEVHRTLAILGVRRRVTIEAIFDSVYERIFLGFNRPQSIGGGEPPYGWERTCSCLYTIHPNIFFSRLSK